MATRYIDMGLDATGARDFVVRSRVPSFTQILIIFASAFLIAVSITVSVHDVVQLIVTLLALFAILGWYIIIQLMRSRDMLLVTEFQNALFASAMGLHNKFCLIIKRDGFIVYLDRSFQRLFPEIVQSSTRTVDMLLRHGKVDQIDCDRVLSALDKGTYEKVIFDITDAQGVVHHIVLSVEPIMRPAGFTMLRGREYIEDRNSNFAGGGGAGMFSKSSVTLFSHVMESMKMGVYISSPNGSLVYCNPLLEEWLGYGEGEVITRNLNVDHLIPAGRNPGMSAEPADFEGTVQLEKKVGGFLKAFLNQRAIHNESGQLMGCTAVVHLYNDDNPLDETPKGF
ncbi:MAG: PAS domain-containing protein [Alphaproteobacteria bacterium]|nr:PAS domain-containing protein [Alphaproteobacteria bacterium]